VRPAFVKKLIREFDPLSFGTITVCFTPEDGVYHLIDGQNRVECMRTLGGGGAEVHCEIIHTKDVALAAKIFYDRNKNRGGVPATEAFKTAVSAKLPAQVEIKEILDSFGLAVGRSRGSGTVRGISTVERIHLRFGADVLRKTLAIMIDAWGRSREALDSTLMGGVASFLYRHGDNVKTERVIKVLRRGPPAIHFLSHAKSRRVMTRCSVTEGVAGCIVDAYNVRIKAGRLDASLGPKRVLAENDASKRDGVK